jgi:hypothetical protein
MSEQTKPNIIIDEQFEKTAIAFATNFPGSTPEKVKELKDNMAGFKEAIAKVNQGTMEYATMRSLYG